MNFIDTYNALIISLIGNVILLFMLLSPNIVFCIHKRWFKWRNKIKDL